MFEMTHNKQTYCIIKWEKSLLNKLSSKKKKNYYSEKKEEGKAFLLFLCTRYISKNMQHMV